LTAQAVKFNSPLGKDKALKPLEGGFGCGRFDMGYAKLTLKVTASGDIAAARQFPDTVCKVVENGKCTDEQSYSYDETALYYKLL
jgi:hypothetical protein